MECEAKVCDLTQPERFSELFEFVLRRAPEGKAVISEDMDALWLEGYAADIDAVTLDALFAPGAFRRAFARFHETNPVVLDRGRTGDALGQIVDWQVDAKGLFLKAMIDRPPDGAPGWAVYERIRAGGQGTFSIALGNDATERTGARSPGLTSRRFRCSMGRSCSARRLSPVAAAEIGSRLSMRGFGGRKLPPSAPPIRCRTFHYPSAVWGPPAPASE